jgi:hypothetical protein
MMIKKNLVALIAGGVATLGFGSAAMAETISIHHAGGCHTTIPVQDGLIDYKRSGIYNFTDFGLVVGCPLVRKTTRSNGAVAHVYIHHLVDQTTSCTLSSYFPSTGVLKIRSNSWTGAGPGRITLRLVGPSASSAMSSYQVDCTLGEGYGSAMHMVTLKER